MAKKTRNNGKGWTRAEVKRVRRMSKDKTPTRVISVKMGRSEAAIRSVAQREGFSLKQTSR
jgi:hypothetical protein